ncbi:hypothetical protein ACE6H2_023555 [Prunus campanulata]
MGCLWVCFVPACIYTTMARIKYLHKKFVKIFSKLVSSILGLCKNLFYLLFSQMMCTFSFILNLQNAFFSRRRCGLFCMRMVKSNVPCIYCSWNIFFYVYQRII